MAQYDNELFPAYAGVIPSYMLTLENHTTFPRIRGGDPMVTSEMRSTYAFSPHTRG